MQKLFAQKLCRKAACTRVFLGKKKYLIVLLMTSLYEIQ